MFQIKIAVEGMKAEIIKAFDSEKISKAIEEASHKAVKEFDIDKFITHTVESVFYQAREVAIVRLGQDYGNKWANELEEIIDEKIKKALKKAVGAK